MPSARKFDLTARPWCSQARYSPVDFDYMSYSALRWGECKRRWQEFMARAEQVFGGAAN
jgi:hypothetical protein